MKGDKAMIIRDSFEATYPHYPFAPLVRAGIAIAAWLTGRKHAAGAAGNYGHTFGSAA